MKKVFAIALAIVLVMVLSVGYARTTTQTCLTYVSANTTGADVLTAVSTSTIIPGIHKIVGYSVRPENGIAAGAWCTLYSGSRERANIIGESEVPADRVEGEIWAYPKHVREGGITLIQSPQSVVLIEYSR